MASSNDTRKMSGRELTKHFEGYRDTIYEDSEGNPTIGYGFNLNDPKMAAQLPPDVVTGQRPLTQEEADTIFDKRYDQAVGDALRYVGDANVVMAMSPIRKNILVDMAYNLGLPALQGFGGMLEGIKKNDHQKTVAEMVDSKWYKQTGRRSKHHEREYRMG